jgi:hypothetical protein
MSEMSVILSSRVDREGLVAEIWWANEMLAEVVKSKEGPMVAFYPREGGSPWNLPLESLKEALAKASAESRPPDSGRTP